MTSEESPNSVGKLSDASQPQQTESSVSNNENPAIATNSNDASQNGNPPLVKKVRVTRKLTQAERDAKNLNLLFGPMLDDLDKLVLESLKEIDRLEDEYMSQVNKNKYATAISHVPKEIREKRPVEDIVKSLENIVANINGVVPLKEEAKEPKTASKESEKAKPKKAEKAEVSVDSEKTESQIENEHEPFDKEVDREPAIDFDKSKLNNLNNVVCLSHSLTSYLITAYSGKNQEKLKELTIQFYDSVNDWLTRLFRFYNASVLFHDQEYDGIIRMCNMLLNYKYKEFQKNGYQAIHKQPTIYISASSKYSHSDYRELMAIQLGLPLSSIRLVKVSKTVDKTLDKIDIDALVSQIEEDHQAGFIPTVIVANAGSFSIGQCDDIQQLQQVAHKYQMWLHLDGFYLSTLALSAIPSQVQPVTSGHSITLNLASWLGIPSLSYITLYRNTDNSGLFIQPFNNFLSTLQKVFPYWCVLQSIGYEGVINRIRYLNDISSFVKNEIQKHRPYLKLFNFKDIMEKNPKVTHTKGLGNVIASAFNFIFHVDLTNPVVIFKCDQKYIKERMFLFSDAVAEAEQAGVSKKPVNRVKNSFIDMMQDVEPLFESDKKRLKKREKDEEEKAREGYESDVSEEIRDYTDTLTTWVGELLNSLHKKIDLDLIEIENEGVCIRYSPMDHANIYGTDENDLEEFANSLSELMGILNASLKCKATFNKEIKEFKNLKAVEAPKWAGVGAVRYVPDYLIDRLGEIEDYLKRKKNGDHMTEHKSNEVDLIDLEPEKKESADQSSDTIEKYIKEINDINKKLAEKLQAQDGAFSLDESTDGLCMIKFGMVDENEALASLAVQVQNVGKEVEESSRFIETMSELVRLGIEKANEDLQKENEQKLIQQGLLRQIPIVNGLFNWFAPTQPVNSTGRSFDLHSGKIASTEVTYKYHMQIEENGNGEETSVSEEQHNDKHQVKSVKELLKATPGRVERRLSQTSVNSAISSANIQLESQAQVEHEKDDQGKHKTLALA